MTSPSPRTSRSATSRARLSTAGALVASVSVPRVALAANGRDPRFLFVFLRGGLDEARVSAIEGMADRRPKLPDDPEAAANRRIEILLIEPNA